MPVFYHHKISLYRQTKLCQSGCNGTLLVLLQHFASALLQVSCVLPSPLCLYLDLPSPLCLYLKLGKYFSNNHHVNICILLEPVCHIQKPFHHARICNCDFCWRTFSVSFVHRITGSYSTGCHYFRSWVL